MKRSITTAVPAILGIATAFTLSACSARGDVANTQAGRIIAFLDQSASIDADQRALWRRESDVLVRQIGNGTSFSVYPIHDRTLEAAPLFTADVPASSGDDTLDEAAIRHKALIQARTGAKRAIEGAFQGGNAAQTDIFGALDRIHADPKARGTILVFFSDMLNSTRDLDMERPGSVRRQSIPELVQNLAARHNWHAGQLAGVQVYCVLNSIASGHNGPAIDRITQRVFYETLFTALGAHLMLYEPHIPGPILPAPLTLQQGGNNVPARL